MSLRRTLLVLGVDALLMILKPQGKLTLSLHLLPWGGGGGGRNSHNKNDEGDHRKFLKTS